MWGVPRDPRRHGRRSAIAHPRQTGAAAAIAAGRNRDRHGGPYKGPPSRRQGMTPADENAGADQGLTRFFASCLSVRGPSYLSVRGQLEACQAFSRGPWPEARNAVSCTKVSRVLLNSKPFGAAVHSPQRVDSTPRCVLSDCMTLAPPMPLVPRGVPLRMESSFDSSAVWR
jgi:hypothetical protein